MGELIPVVGGDDGGFGILSTIVDPAVDVLKEVPIVGPALAGLLEQGLGAGNIAGIAPGMAGLDPTAPGAGAIGLAPGLSLTPPGTVDLTGWSGGNGRYVTRTTVETMDKTTGTIVNLRRAPGQPYMMNRDVSAMKKVLRQIGALNKRVPRKTRALSKTEQLKEAAISAAIRGTQKECCCPK